MFWLTVAYAADDLCSSWTASERVAEVDRMPSAESSALAVFSDGFFTLDDSGGAAELYAFDLAGNFLRTLVVEGATNTDWEDLAVAPCEEGECAFIGDIGDNDESRDHITIWRAPLAGTALTATACDLAFEDGLARDAEALLLFPDESVRIVTKSAGTTKVFYAPPLVCDGTVQSLTEETDFALDEPVTGGTVSADGSLVVLRGLTMGWAWRGCTLDWSAAPQPLLFVGEQQGEGVAIAADGTLYSSSEGEEFELHELPCAASEPLVCDECGCGSGGAIEPWALAALGLVWRRRTPGPTA